MVTPKGWVTINTSLAIISILLFIILIGVDLPNLGQALYALDPEPELYVIDSKGELNPGGNLNRFCLEATKTLGCRPEPLAQFDWACANSKADPIQYRMNNKAYQYCILQEFWQ